MKPLRALIAAVALSSLGVAAAAEPVDSVDAAVAGFIASNFKLTLTNALTDFAKTGVKFNEATVRKAVIEQMSTPYDAEQHRRDVTIIENAVAAVAAADSDSLLNAAKSVPGAIITPSGLVFRADAPGQGPVPTTESTVAIRYVASLPDGTVVDEIRPDEAPMVTQVGELAPGVAEGLTMMQAGGTYTLTIPAALAYGHEGIDGVIPPDCAMQFIVNLISIE